MKVEVRPIKKPRWHGHTGKDSFTRPKTLNVLIDAQTRQYATGLDYVKRTFTDPDGTNKKLTEAEYYGKLLKSDLSANFIPEKYHPFWDSKQAKVKLENKTMFFDDNIPIQHIHIQMMKASKFVANSMKELEEGKFPFATHVITDEAEEIEAKATKIEAKNEAIFKLRDLSRERKIQIILILNGKNLRGKSDKFIITEMDKLVEKQPKELLEYINMDSTRMSINALVLEALQRNILTQEGHKIQHFGSTIGGDITERVDYLSLDENQDLKLRIMKQLTE